MFSITFLQHPPPLPHTHTLSHLSLLAFLPAGVRFLQNVPVKRCGAWNRQSVAWLPARHCRCYRVRGGCVFIWVRRWLPRFSVKSSAHTSRGSVMDWLTVHTNWENISSVLWLQMSKQTNKMMLPSVSQLFEWGPPQLHCGWRGFIWESDF